MKEKITAKFVEAVAPAKEFQLLDLEAERHGCWEWVAYRSAPPLNRFVFLVISEEEREYEVQCLAGADNDAAYSRRTVQPPFTGKLKVRRDEKDNRFVTEEGDNLKVWLEKAIREAMNINEIDGSGDERKGRYLPTL